MLARRGKLVHPHAGEIELPLLIPAFSSKGSSFQYTGRGVSRRPYSELAYTLEEFSKWPATSSLVSAYDLHHQHFVAPKLSSKNVLSFFANCRIILIDSGGYELDSDFDSTEPKTFSYQPRSGYGEREYLGVLSQISREGRHLHMIIANFDYLKNGMPLSSQIQMAKEIFCSHPSCLSDFIMKPWTKKSMVIEPSKMTPDDFANLRGFHIVGVTEKELGSNLLERLAKIAALRKGLDEAGIRAPIHVWGGLDPVLTPLFFFAGAEIFDGVSWLRYAYNAGVAVNRESYAVLESKIGINSPGNFPKIMVCFDNLAFLDNLTVSLQQWVDFGGGNFSMFDKHVRDHLQRAYETMKTKIPLL